MKTVVAGALGECVHVAGVMNFLHLAELAGWHTVFLGPAVPIETFLQAAREEKADLIGVSYRLTPETGERLLAEFAEAADDLRQQGVRFAFGGTPPVAAKAAAMAGFFERVFDGSQPPEEILAYLRGETASTPTESSYPQTTIERIAWKAPYPILRHHFGLPTMEATLEGIQKIAEARVLDVISLGIDQDAQLMDALIRYVIVIVAISLLLMVILFRSLLIPLIATIGYLLSVGASFGASVAVFQWGWLDPLIAAPQGDPMMSLLPLLLVGVLFGLAMDYQVFLVSRIQEMYHKGLAPKQAIREGFARSGPVLVAAATIMIVVFAGFATSSFAVGASIALGLMVGVAADAFIVRLILMPAMLSLLGKAAGGFPSGWTGSCRTWTSRAVRLTRRASWAPNDRTSSASV